MSKKTGACIVVRGEANVLGPCQTIFDLRRVLMGEFTEWEDLKQAVVNSDVLVLGIEGPEWTTDEGLVDAFSAELDDFYDGAVAELEREKDR